MFVQHIVVLKII